MMICNSYSVNYFYNLLIILSIIIPLILELIFYYFLNGMIGFFIDLYNIFIVFSTYYYNLIIDILQFKYKFNKKEFKIKHTQNKPRYYTRYKTQTRYDTQTRSKTQTESNIEKNQTLNEKESSAKTLNNNKFIEKMVYKQNRKIKKLIKIPKNLPKRNLDPLNNTKLFEKRINNYKKFDKETTLNTTIKTNTILKDAQTQTTLDATTDATTQTILDATTQTDPIIKNDASTQTKINQLKKIINKLNKKIN